MNAGENITNPFPGKYIIGLTGNIATGKSAVLRMAGEHGALVIDADKVVHEILNEDPAVQEAIVAAFGPQVRRADGGINRAVLGKIVFNDPRALQKLESMVHPAVQQHVARQIIDSPRRVVMIEAIKLLEGALRLICQQIWVTNCTRQTQLNRLIVCRGMDEISAGERIDAQSPPEEKIAQADVVIHTDGLYMETAKQFEQAWSRLVIEET